MSMNYRQMPEGGSGGRSSGGDPGYVTRGGERVSNPGDIYGSMLEILNPQKDTFENPTDKWSHLLGGENASPGRAADAKRQEDLQREFAQHGIRWRVEDAVRAGLNPEAALGTSGASYTPTATMTSSSGGSGSDFGYELARMGQNLVRSMGVTMTMEERIAARLKLENMDLNNELLRTQIRQMGQTPPGPGTESASGQVNVQPQKVTSTDKVFRHSEPHAIADVGYARTSSGLAPVPTSDVKERIEDQFIPETAWAIRNYGAAWMGKQKPIHLLKKEFPGAIDFKWQPFKMEWQPVYSGYKSFRSKIQDWGNKYFKRRKGNWED